MRAEEKIASLEKQLQEALEQLKEVRDLFRLSQKQLQQAQFRIAELEKQKTPSPPFVKANKKKPRKKRESQYNHARKRSVPTQIVEHRIVACPDCHLRLGGISLARCREVIDVPAPPVVEVTDHRIYKGWCAGCQQWYEAPLDLQEQVVGHGRIGVRLDSLIGTLRTVMRLPIRQLQA